MYRPWTVFAALALVFGLLGVSPFVRYAILLLQGDQGNHFQSLILGTLLLVGSLLSLALGVLSDLQRTNRTLQEDLLERVKEQQFGPARPATAPKPSATPPSDAS